MIVIVFERAVALLLLAANGFTTPVVESDKEPTYEKYVIEHEISTQEAKNAVLSTNIEFIVTPPGCHKCTAEEKHYCLSRDLINDHCCCDKRYHEMVPFIPHTCYLGSQLCSPVASDCSEYHRLFSCCCQKYAFQKWKEKSNDASLTYNKINRNLFILIYFVYYVT